MTTVTTPRHRGLHVPGWAWTAILLLLAVGAVSVLAVNWPIEEVGERQPEVGAEAYYWEEVGRLAVETGSAGTAAVTEPYYLQVLDEAALEGRVALADQLAETYWADVNEQALVLSAEPHYLQVLGEAALEGRVALAEQLAETYWADITEEALERGKVSPDPAGVRERLIEEIEVSGG